MGEETFVIDDILVLRETYGNFFVFAKTVSNLHVILVHVILTRVGVISRCGTRCKIDSSIGSGTTDRSGTFEAL